MILNSKKNCNGCCACLNKCPQNCISIHNDNEGFWYPVVDKNSCVDCNLCKEVCPVINKVKVKNNPKAFGCINKNEKIRLNSSSGGIFTLLAENIILNGGVVFGARFNQEFSVVHCYAETKEELEELRGSKYVQSKIGETFKEVENYLKEGRKVLFSGTPCQIAGLKSFLRKTYNSLFTIDIICHGVPSPLVWQKYIEYREEVAGSKTRRIAFRRKDEGWKLYSILFIFGNDMEYMQTFRKDLYMRAFLKDICLRPSCYNCQFKTLNRESDITLADFWGVQNIIPELDDNKGTSLIFVNSAKGTEMFKELKDNIRYKEVDIEDAVRYNSAALKSAKYNPQREGFFKDLDRFSFDQLVKKYCSDPLLLKIKGRIKSIIRKILKKLGLLTR